MIRRRLAICIATLFLVTVRGDLNDPCTILQTDEIAGKPFFDTTEVSICLDTGYCSHTSDPITVSCERAFYMLTSEIRRRVRVPPIIANRRVYAPYISINMTEQTLIMRQFFRQIKKTTTRILTGFPRLVYVDYRDGDMLRELAELTKTISGFSRFHPEIVSQLRRVNMVIKWKWSVCMMADYISTSGLSFAEIEDMLISTAPFFHAFFHVSYYLPIVNDGEIANCFDYDLLTTIVKYHPLYTYNEDDEYGKDGVWYIRIGASYYDDETGTTINFLVDSEPDDLADVWGTRLDTRAFPAMLFQSISDHSINRTDPDHLRKLKLGLYTMKFFHEIPLVKPVWLPNIEQALVRKFVGDGLLIDQYVEELDDEQEFRDLLMMLRPCLIPDIKMKLVLAYSKTNKKFLGQTTIRSEIHSNPSFEDKMGHIADLDKYHLSLNFEIYDNRTIDDNTNQSVSVNVADYYLSLLVEAFDPRNGIFARNHHGRFELNRTMDHDEIDLYSIRRDRVFVGRLMALIIREGCGHYLRDYLPTYSTVSSLTVLESIFFNSWYVRSGFYDVYHEGILERVFENNGMNALAGILR